MDSKLLLYVVIGIVLWLLLSDRESTAKRAAYGAATGPQPPYVGPSPSGHQFSQVPPPPPATNPWDVVNNLISEAGSSFREYTSYE